MDRPLRPLFPKAIRTTSRLSSPPSLADQENDLETLSLIGASAALTISDIPFGGPVAGVQGGYVNDEYIINPLASQMEGSQLDLTVAARPSRC